jgi:MFS family permease
MFFATVFIFICLVISSFTHIYWVFFIIFPLGVGFGSGILIITPLSILSRYFEKNRGKAIGLC